ncbi:MAG: type II toxin-antitoxin system prevent-host-death family antitoxin [Actinomycetota bacterium]|nr:type II toxin-antitoxin system prevent-host-death family antitoxin [Actinomycetota bacterium]
MEGIGVRELRQNVSEWLRRAQAGERIQVTKRGQVVAVLGPPLATEPSTVSVKQVG